MQLDKYRNLEVSYIGESGEYSPGFIKVYGTSYNCTDTGVGYVEVKPFNSKNLLRENTQGRGITLYIFSPELDLNEVIRYDTYGTDSHRTNLANKLNDIHSGALGNVVYAMASFDAVGTNTNLKNAMITARAYHFFQMPGLTNGPTHRHPYVAIGTSDLGIIKESLHSNTSGADPAIVTANIPDNWATIGSEGYGPDLLEMQRMGEYSTDNSYGFGVKNAIDWNAAGWKNVKPGEYVRLSCEARVDLARAQSGGQSRLYLYETDWSSAAAEGTTSSEWVKIEVTFKKPTSNIASTFGFGPHRWPSSDTTGTAYFRNAVIQKCGFSPNADRDISVSAEGGISGKNIVESPGPFNLLDPDTYYDFWNSSRNLTGRPNLYDSRFGSGPFDTDSVVWFNRTLTNRNEYSIHEGKNFTGDSNRYTDIGRVDINPDKMYLGCIWHYCHEKGDGYNYLGTHTYNSSNGTTSTHRYDYGGNTTNPYSMYPNHGNIEKGTWQLWSYWFLPRWFTDAEGTDFYNNYYCKWAGNYENGRGGNTEIGNAPHYNPTSNGGNIRVAKFTDNDAKIHLRWLDFYNTAIDHKTWWALPAIFEVDPMNFLNGGDIYSWNIKEV